MTYQAIIVERHDHVATITLNRPDVLNAQNNPMREELMAVFAALKSDEEVRAIIVTGAGERAFSAGADIKEFLAPPVPTRFRDQRKRLDYRGEMDRCPQPIIAAIRGFALGGGLELALGVRHPHRRRGRPARPHRRSTSPSSPAGAAPSGCRGWSDAARPSR